MKNFPNACCFAKIMKHNESRWYRGIVIALVANALIISTALAFVGMQIRFFRLTAIAPAPGVLPFSGGRHVETTSAFDQSKLRTNIKSDYIYGAGSARISLISYMDYECPFCAKIYPTAKKLVDMSAGKVNLVLRFYPLDSHPHADPLANAGECIGHEKGNAIFWRFSDVVFGGDMSKGGVDLFFDRIVPLFKLDNASFRKCVSSGKYEPSIKESLNEGNLIGVTGTPSIVIYDRVTKKAKFIAGTRSLDALQKEIDSL